VTYQKRRQQETATDAGDIPGRIERLVALRDQGILTTDEFEAKKRDLLSRM
jgi:hypothetical protein